ncbi:MAG: PFL_4669 family integrating conjugative element protein [Gammaproteobacteria bacterium]
MLAKNADEILQNQNVEKNKASPLNVAGEIVLHTRIAQSLFNGSWQEGRIGLLQFAKSMAVLWKEVRNDDPYAEWYLMKTYQALFDTRAWLNTLEKQVTPHFTNAHGIEINTCLSTCPMRYPLRFATPFGFMGAALIADADHMVRQMLTLERIGVSLNSDDISIKKIVQSVQDIFYIARQWQYTGITRQDILENNQKSQEVVKLLGVVPPAILNKEIEFAFLPKTKGKKHG